MILQKKMELNYQRAATIRETYKIPVVSHHKLSSLGCSGIYQNLDQSAEVKGLAV
jgi:hypothetical protein